MKRSPLKRGNRLRQASPKRQSEYKQYTQVRNAYLIINPVCQRCKKAKATDIHHKAGRVGKWLCLDKYFAALCRSCHDEIHSDPKAARKQSWIIDTFHALPSLDKALLQSQAHTPEQGDSKSSPC